jgi:ComF family protein
MRKPVLSEQLIDMLYPSECAGCGRPYALPLCDSCFLEVASARGPVAAGHPGGLAFVGLRAAGGYAGPLKDMVLRLKGSEGRMALQLAALMALSLGNEPGFLMPAAVCFVPSSRRKVAERGYNPAALLAAKVASILGRPLADALLVDGKMRDQDRTPGAERWANVKGAFRAQPGAAPRGRVLLVDDVLTTGATADACSRLLLERGASSVLVLVAARAVLRRAGMFGEQSP